MITKASADGTLFTRNWDIEPLFPLPTTSLDMVEQRYVTNYFFPLPNTSLDMVEQKYVTNHTVFYHSCDHFRL